MAGKPGFGGKKGRSGRRRREEQTTRREVLQMAWDKVHSCLKKEKTGFTKASLEICLKDMATKLKGEGFDSKHYTNIIQNLPSDAGELQRLVESLRKRVSKEGPPVASGE